MTMSQGEKREVTARELRQFGCVLGAMLLALGGVLLWRSALLAGGAVIVAALALAHIFWWQWPVARSLYGAWMAVAVLLSAVMTRVLLALLYGLVLLPVALLARVCGKRFLALAFREETDSYWQPRDPEQRRHNNEKQY